MSEPIAVQDQIAETVALLRAQLGVGGKDLGKALRKARHRLPRRIYRQATKLAQVELMAGHPKLRLALDTPALAKAAREVQDHLRSIDVADRRKGRWLGALGALAFNILLFGALVIAFMMWRGLI